MSINYDNTTSCTNDSQCKLAYSNDNWVCDTTNNKCALKCFSILIVEIINIVDITPI